MTVRLRLCEPVPHDLVHADQAEKAEVAQWTGHGPWLHTRVSAECGHALPPNVGSTVARLRFCEPVPHDFVHVDHAPNAGTAQSTAHDCSLQARVSAECGHALPPSVGATVARLRFCEPVPHDFVHVDHAPNAGTTQSVAHDCSLQTRVSSRYGHT